ncbi:MAG: NAD(P)-dependent glycerol-3-phosphate dehydrogenase [Bradyrhizobiaceae bacterium]|nr:NAD(P)-dependent glycerol-3-phosphate dehydrogenase [Bradyrhizobiaceae bacterium]
MATQQRISVLGAGAWGTALANALARLHPAVTLYARDPAVVAEIAKEGTNARYLPGVAVAPGITPTASLEKAADADLLLLVVPAQSLRALARELAPHLRAATPLIACAKGIERGTGRFVTEILVEETPQAQPAILSGPSFALDVARGLPTAVTLAAADERFAAALAEALRSLTFRVYHSTDVRGVEIGGAAKNVLAIAAGIVVGRHLGASAQAALTTRGFAELLRFGRAYGARPETITGLSGLGDLILTCTSPQSRNYAFGVALGAGKPLTEAGGGKLAEGAFTASVLVEMARKKGVEMPIAEAVDDLLSGRVGVEEAIGRLLARPMGSEV